jgi:pimeloyl-ACP methyl ester carboxylesterase
MIRSYQIEGTAISAWVNDGGFSGSRKSIVFLHGSGGDHKVWDRQCGALSGEFNVAAVDLPGHGLSGGAGEDDVGRYVEWVKKIIGALGLATPVLAGHSLGAAISLTFATRYGSLLSAIVPVGGGCEMPVNSAIFDGLRDNHAATIDMILKFAVEGGTKSYKAESALRRSSGLRPARSRGGSVEDRAAGSFRLRRRRQNDPSRPFTVSGGKNIGCEARPHRGRRPLRHDGKAGGVQQRSGGICQGIAIERFEVRGTRTEVQKEKPGTSRLDPVDRRSAAAIKRMSLRAEPRKAWQSSFEMNEIASSLHSSQ